MRFLGKLVLGLVVLVGALAVAAFALPREIEVSRSIVVNATANDVFPHVNDLKKFTEWSPWAKIDPNTTYEYSGPERGVGQKVRWSSDHENVGSGTQEITESVADRKVATALDFGDMGQATAQFLLEPEGSGTRVTWGFDKWIGADYDKGLANLKAVAERT